MMIGICGKSGSGKSTLAQSLVQCYDDAAYLDIDKIGHQVLLLPNVFRDLVETFGFSIVEDGQINRRKLSTIVFGSCSNMQKLTDITWPAMQSEIDQFLNCYSDKMVILDWQLLPLSQYFYMCDIRILLDTPYELRRQRAMIRDHITEDEFALRDSASIDFCDDDFHYILQDNSLEEVQRLVNTL